MFLILLAGSCLPGLNSIYTTAISKDQSSQLSGMMRTIRFALENCLADNSTLSPAQLQNFFPFKKAPIDPRTGRPVKLKSGQLKIEEWEKLKAGDTKISSRFTEKCVVYFIDLESACVLFSTDSAGHCPFGRFNNPSLVIEREF